MKIWTKEEIEWVKEYFPKYGTKYCAAYLNRSYASIRHIYKKEQILSLSKQSPIGKFYCKCCRQYKNKKLQILCSKRGNTYKRNLCIICHNIYNKNKYNEYFKHPEKSLKQKIKKLLSGAKKRAKEKKLEFNLTYEWFIQNSSTTCPVLNKDYYIQTQTGSHTAPNMSRSLDRINNKKGYTKDNTVIVSRRVNLIKNDATIEELQKITNFYVQLEKNKIPEDYCI